jgi:diguanylate cyclase (GGDEF)-like protein
MNNAPLARNQKLLALQQSYIAQLPDKLAKIRAYWEQVQHSPDDSERFDELYRGVHSLAGSAGTFSFFTLGQLARQTEQQLKQWHGQPHEAALVQTINDLLAQLLESAAAGPEGKPAPVSETTPTVTKTQSAKQLVYILDDDGTHAEELADQLQHFNYCSIVFSDTVQLQKVMNTKPPAALISNVHLKEGPWRGTQFVQQSETIQQHNIPVIYVSGSMDWQTRLATVRAAGRAFLSKPLDVTAVVEQLAQLTTPPTEDPYRVLIVEDTELLAQHYANVLQNAGMQTEVLTDASQLLDRLPEFKPELILLDLYMPCCSGIEAAQVIRQNASYNSIPIVFLSTEQALGRQLSAMGHGGDDFLQKPIQDQHLIAAVSIRAQRFRTLKSLMIRDSLTGLLNHITLKQNLQAAIAQTLRSNSVLSFVMLDIDHFKSINDTHGHPCGDRVIKTLARLLTERLRKSDIVGRYGGEEFALLLPDTDVSVATRLVNGLREDFSRIGHSSTSYEFRVTFSAGIASTPPHTDMDSLIRSADEALYDAKHAGRNRVKMQLV